MNNHAEEQTTDVITSVQLRLFPPPKPLLDRFGEEFFRKIPACPGVYFFSDQAQRLLYIGQSLNLRARLNSYKNLNPERSSRKLVRLVHLARSITWEICDSPEQAQLRENELLRLYKPVLNVANTRPEHYAFIGLRSDSSRICLRLTKLPTAESQETLYGAFKGLGSARAALSALLRSLWTLDHPSSLSPHDIPSNLIHGIPLEQASWDVRELKWPDLGVDLDSYFSGISSRLVERLMERLASQKETVPFLIRLHHLDLECLNHFYQLGPKRSYDLRQRFHIRETIIPSKELDDLLVLSRLVKKKEAAEPRG